MGNDLVEGTVERDDRTHVTATADALLTAGRFEDALTIVAEAVANGCRDEGLLSVGASAWVAAVDAGSPLAAWPAERRTALLRTLIIGETGMAPVLHQRIAAQHSGGVAGHLTRQGVALGPLILNLLDEQPPHPRAVLLALLLRDTMAGIDQDALGQWHRQMFASFTLDDLAIPYSVIFEPRFFRRNLADLCRYVRERGRDLLDGSVSLPHLLTLYWLVPDTFDALPPDWHHVAIDRRLSNLPTLQQAAAARSLLLRFGGPVPAAVEPRVAVVAAELAALRQALAREAGTAKLGPAARLDSRPRQAAASLINMARIHVPRLIPARRRLRVALCISGQLRGYRQAWVTWRPLLAGVDATVFVDSWRKIGRGTPEPFRSTLPFAGREFCVEYKKIGAEIGLAGLRERYPTLFAALDNSGTVDEHEVCALYDTPHVRLEDESGEIAGFSNADKMYYKVERCARLMDASGQDFDLVVRLRPDKPIRLVGFDWSDMLAALRGAPALYCETAFGVHYGAILMGDQVAIGLPGTMRVYAYAFSLAPRIAAVAPYRMEPHRWGHTSIAQLCWMSGIDVRKVPIRFDTFREAEPLSVTAIRHSLSADAAGRMDAIDRQLIAANRVDARG